MKLSTLFGALVVLSLVLPGAARAQRDFSNVEIKSTPVSGNIHMLEGSGGNIGVSVGVDGLLIVDDQFAPLANKIETALARLDQGDLKFVLNTHWHGDHTGGNAHFGRKASIVAHTNVRKRLVEADRTPKEGLPVITFDRSLSLHFNEEEIKVIHLPSGHTDGDSVIHFTQSGVVHMGDHFFNGAFPYVDLGSGGDVAGYIQNVKTVLGKLPGQVKIIPGHGPLATRADLERFHAMLLETTGLVRQAMADGKTVEQAKEAGLPAKWKEWGVGFISTDRWIEIVYNSYSKD